MSARRARETVVIFAHPDDGIFGKPVHDVVIRQRLSRKRQRRPHESVRRGLVQQGRAHRALETRIRSHQAQCRRRPLGDATRIVRRQVRLHHPSRQRHDVRRGSRLHEQRHTHRGRHRAGHRLADVPVVGGPVDHVARRGIEHDGGVVVVRVVEPVSQILPAAKERVGPGAHALLAINDEHEGSGVAAMQTEWRAVVVAGVHGCLRAVTRHSRALVQTAKKVAKTKPERSVVGLNVLHDEAKASPIEEVRHALDISIKRAVSALGQMSPDVDEQQRVADAELERNRAISGAIAIARLDETGEGLVGRGERSGEGLREHSAGSLPVRLAEFAPPTSPASSRSRTASRDAGGSTTSSSCAAPARSPARRRPSRPARGRARRW